MPQDPRVEASQDEINTFFGYIANKEDEKKTTEDFEEIELMLQEQPSLVYATTNLGNTALYIAISRGREEDLETARIIMQYEPDLQQSRVGRALQSDMEPHIRDQMARIVLGDSYVSPHSNALENADSTIAESKAYNNQAHVKKTDANLEKIAKAGSKKKGGDKCTIMSVHEITYGEELNKIFKNMNPLSMYQQKMSDQESYQNVNNDSIINSFDFSPSSFESSSKDNLISEDITSTSDFSSLILGITLILVFSHSVEISTS